VKQLMAACLLAFLASANCDCVGTAKPSRDGNSGPSALAGTDGPSLDRSGSAAPLPAEIVPVVKPVAEPATKSAAAQPTSAPEPRSRPLISVGRATITSDRLDKAMAALKRRWASRNQELTREKVTEAKKVLYKNWIDEALVNDYLRNQILSAKEIDSAKREMAKRVIMDRLIGEYLRDKRPPSKEQVEAEAEELLNKKVEMQEALSSYKEFKRWDDEQLELHAKLHVLESRATTPEKAAALVEQSPISYFDGTRLTVKHLLIAYKAYDKRKAKQDAEQKCKVIAKAVRTGRLDFADAARMNSDCPSASKGGKYGPFRLSDVPERFAAVANALEPGETGGPFETFFGWHVIQLIKREEGSGQVSANADKVAAGILKNQLHKRIITESARNNPVTIHEPPTATDADMAPVQGAPPSSAPATRPARRHPRP